MERLFPKAKLVQDLPPPGGFPAFDLYKERHIPRMPPGLFLWGVAGSIVAYGWYKLIKVQNRRVYDILLV